MTQPSTSDDRLSDANRQQKAVSWQKIICEERLSNRLC